MGARRLWSLLHDRGLRERARRAHRQPGRAAGASAGLKAIYLSGWQVAADANLTGNMYPDQSLYPANSVPHVVERINRALQRADQIECTLEGTAGQRYWFAPIVADAEAGFGGPLNAHELMKGDDRGGGRRACTSRTSSRPRRSAATWAARCSCPRASSCAPEQPRGSRPTCSTCPRVIVARTDAQSGGSCSRATSTSATTRS